MVVRELNYIASFTSSDFKNIPTKLRYRQELIIHSNIDYNLLHIPYLQNIWSYEKYKFFTILFIISE